MKTEIEDLVWPAEAAKRLHKHPSFIRKLIKDAGIGRIWGGSEKRPLLKVKFSELERVMMNNRYVRPGAPKRQKAKPMPQPVRAGSRYVKC